MIKIFTATAGFLIVNYLALLIGHVTDNYDLEFDERLNLLVYYSENRFLAPLFSPVGEVTINLLLLGNIIFTLVVLAFFVLRKKLRPGEEHGSAHFAPKRAFNKLKHKEPEKNISATRSLTTA